MQEPNIPPPPVDGPAAATSDEPEAAVGAAPAPDVDTLLRKAEAQAGELKDAWLRARAESDNVRKQAANDVAKAHKYAIERFALDLLPVRDALEQTLAQAGAGGAPPEALVAGVELTLKQLGAAFDKAGLVAIDPAGEKFDPHRHQAMQMVDSNLPPNTVVTVFQKGYLLNDRVLRPALVTVAKSADGQG